MDNNQIPKSITRDLKRLGELMTAPLEDFRKASESAGPILKQMAELNQDLKKIANIPESTLAMMRDAQKSYKAVSDTINSLGSRFPKVDIPKLSTINFEREEMLILPRIDPEENEWKRHNESLKIQDSILKIQTSILEEQRSNTKLSNKIFYLSIAGIVIPVVVTVAGILFEKAIK